MLFIQQKGKQVAVKGSGTSFILSKYAFSSNILNYIAQFSQKDAFIAPFFGLLETGTGHKYSVSLQFSCINFLNCLLKCYVLWLVVKYLSMAISVKFHSLNPFVVMQEFFEICIALNMKKDLERDIWVSFDVFKLL